jgi:hypothetical protein
MKFPALMLPFLISTAAAAAEPAAYCGQFDQAVCFTLHGDGGWTHKNIIDFTIDVIQLGKDFHVTIYQGVGLAEQEDVGTVTSAKAYDAPSGKVEVYLGSKPSPRYFDAHYTPKSGWGTVQVFGYVKDAEQAHAFADFISAIHPCKTDSLAVSCSAETPLKDAANIVRGLGG